ncbi:MAG: hypothetical protein Q8K45_14155 [Rubrivivax sp.]|nr:hypothetical protein [Rubrivivax sp.]
MDSATTARSVALTGRNVNRWPLLAAAVAALGLLFALGAVARQAVRQAEARHANTAARADANWRCNTLPARDERMDCRQRAGGLLSDAVATHP